MTPTIEPIERIKRKPRVMPLYLEQQPEQYDRKNLKEHHQPFLDTPPSKKNKPSNKIIALPLLVLAQVKLIDVSLEECHKDFMHIMKLNQLEQSAQKERLEKEAKEVDTIKGRVNNNDYAVTIVSALSDMAAFVTGACLIYSGNVWAGSALILSSLTSTAAKAYDVQNSKYAAEFQALSIVLAIGTIAVGGHAAMQSEAFKNFTQFSTVTKGLLQTQKSYYKVKSTNLEKKFYISSENFEQFRRLLNKNLKTMKDICDKQTHCMESSIMCASSLANMIVDSSKRA